MYISMTPPKNHAVGDILIVAKYWSLYGSYVAF